MEPRSRLLGITVLLARLCSDRTIAYPTSASCDDFSDKCALVVEAKALGIGLDVIMCNTEENGGLLSDFCPVTCNTCMGK